MNQVPEQRRSNTKRDVQRFTAAQRRVEALKMRLEGHDYRTIAETLSVSVSMAYGDVQTALRDIPAPNVEALRKEEGEKLDLLLLALAPKIRQGNARSIEVAVRICERKAKLFGLDAPQRVAVRVLTKELMDEAILELEAQLRELE